ncbi:T9SS type A sorting domain-containing protein [Pedobacter sp. SD-b]|uniref:T9SS type A sorting domain-containing protein n=1 Tax=Pedobacter segetis TaxID=2793069 RepID=A0ABS1BJQ2_9SPHI|nr:pectinesterase family protein [Pedobacter segetis]MBK0383095.1 T9SS type A sorting domain-containing protein [Pedobacter segetis]
MKPIITKVRWNYLLSFLLLFLMQSAFAQYDKTVDKTGTGDYTTVQAAIDAAPTGLIAPYRIFIKNGIYKEIVTVPSNKPFIQLVGESVAGTIITYDNYSGKAIPGGGVYGTSTSATVTISATDFSAVNITFQNTTGDAPQALAINVNNDRASFKNCRFLGGQDTLLANNNGLRQYYLNCYIDGVVDFIFGNARAVFDNCVIYPKDRKDGNSSYITAANTKNPEPYGFVFRNSQITENTGITKYVLGRPWQNDAATTVNKSENRTVYLNTKMGASVSPAGWSTWDSGTDTNLIIYGEYNSQNTDGSPYDVSSRVSWSKQFTTTDAAVYSDANLFAGWDPTAVFIDAATYTAPLVVSNFQGTKGATTTPFKWNISWPITGVQYDVYRSTDNGMNYSIVNTQTSSDANVNFNYTAPNPPPGSSYQYYVKATKSSYADNSSDIVTISSVPTVTVTGSLGVFLQGLGTPSTSQSYTVSGLDLTNDIIITPPVGYEISSNGGTNWYDLTNPIHLVPTSGAVANTSISVRLNVSTAATYSGNITQTSTGAIDVNQAVSGTVQSGSLTVSATLINWPLTADNVDNSLVRATGVTATTPTLNGFVPSDGTTNTSFPPYSSVQGQSFAVNAAGGGWSSSSTPAGPGNLNTNFYEQFTVQPSANYQIRVDTISFNTSVELTTGNFAVSYSLDDFTNKVDLNTGIAPDGNSIMFTSNGVFPTTAIAMIREDAANISKFKFPVSNLNIQNGQTLKIRIYFKTGSSSSTNRYVKVKDFLVKGESSLAPVLGDYQSHQSGDWTALSTWERYDGTAWVTPAPDYPVYNNSGKSTIQNGHTITVSSSLANGSGYIHLTTVKLGGQLVVSSGADLKLSNDGDANTVDLLVNGNMNINGTLSTNGACTIEVGGKLVNSNSISLNGTDILTIDSLATYQHNANSPNAPTAVWKTGSNFLITGLTTSQTSIFKNTINYYNIIWDNQNEASGKYYAVRGNLTATNVLGKLTVKSTGATYISLFNADGTTTLPSGYEQTGGKVLVRESGTVNAIFNIGKDFAVTGGTFESNSAASVILNLTGASSKYNYDDATHVLTNLNTNISGNYTLQSSLNLNNLALTGNGKITLGANTLTTTLLTGGSSSAYVITNGVGKLKINNIGTTNVTFPIGTSATSYNPVTINNAGIVDNFSMSVQNTFDNATPNNNQTVNKQWNIEEDIAGGSNATLTLGWSGADQAVGFNPSNPISLLHYTSGNWAGTLASISGSGTVADPYLATASGFNSFSPFGVGNSTVLPLDLISFTASVNKGLSPKVNLSWKTTNEVNTLKFDVERSFDGKSFSNIGLVNAMNTPGIHDYAFVDDNPLTGTAYYRLNQIDLNGANKYSPIEAVNLESYISLSVYPNPVSNILNIIHPKANDGASLSIVSLNGQKLFTIGVNKDNTKTSTDISKLSSGAYFMMFDNGSQQSALKFIKN